MCYWPYCHPESKTLHCTSNREQNSCIVAETRTVSQSKLWYSLWWNTVLGALGWCLWYFWERRAHLESFTCKIRLKTGKAEYSISGLVLGIAIQGNDVQLWIHTSRRMFKTVGFYQGWLKDWKIQFTGKDLEVLNLFSSLVRKFMG